MLSATIIESSTTIPRTRIMAARETRLIVSPLTPKRNTEPSRLTGRLIATQNAVLNDRKTPRTTKTRISPKIPLLVTISRRFLTYRDLSSEKTISSLLSYFLLSLVSSFLTKSTVSITSAFACFLTLIVKPELPFTLTMVSSLAEDSSIVATSFNLTIGPSKVDFRTTSPISELC